MSSGIEYHEESDDEIESLCDLSPVRQRTISPLPVQDDEGEYQEGQEHQEQQENNNGEEENKGEEEDEDDEPKYEGNISDDDEEPFVKQALCHYPTMVNLQRMYNSYKTLILKDICEQKNIPFDVASFRVYLKCRSRNK
jgi:hypothetical protein